MKADVWSLGCIMHELCELNSPFRKEQEKMNLVDLFNRITNGQCETVKDARYS